METKKRALGKGLEQLFETNTLDFDSLEEKIIEEATEKNRLTNINVDKLISNPYQPRKKFDPEALEELTSSIKEHGVFQPIIVKKQGEEYIIVAGERRAKASKLAGLETIPAIISDFTDQEMMEIALLENLQREDLNAIEEAKAYVQIINTLNLTQEQLAARIGKSRSHVTNIIGLLRLPEKVQNKVIEKEISMGHARVLSKLEDEEKIEKLATRVIKEDLNVRSLENILIAKEPKEMSSNRTSRSKYPELEEALEEHFGTKVRIKNNQLQITFASDQDLNRILEIFNISID